MHALQELPQEPPAVPSSGPADPPTRRAWPRILRCVIGVVGGVLWWGVLLGFAVRPEAVGGWQGALAAGGWSLGLIPLHAVPARVRRSRRGGATAA